MDDSIRSIDALSDKAMPELAKVMGRIYKEFIESHGRCLADNVILHMAFRLLGLHAVRMIGSGMKDAPEQGTQEWHEAFQGIYDDICDRVSKALGECFAEHITDGSVCLVRKIKDTKSEGPKVDWKIEKKDDKSADIEKEAEKLGVPKERLELAKRINHSALDVSAKTTELLHEVCTKEGYDPAALWMAFLSSMTSCVFATVRSDYGEKRAGEFVALLGSSISGLSEKLGIRLSMQILRKDEKAEGA